MKLVQSEQEQQRKQSVPRWLKRILDWRADRRKAESAKLDAELAQVRDELAIAQRTNEQLKQLHINLAALERGEPVRVGDTVFDMSVARYHGRRDDGMFVATIYLDGRARADESEQMILALHEESNRLRAAGHTVL